MTATPSKAKVPTQARRVRRARVDLTIRYLAIFLPLLLVFACAIEVWIRSELDEQIKEELGREADQVLELAKVQAENNRNRDVLARDLEFALNVIEHPARVSDDQGPLARSKRQGDRAEAVFEGKAEGVKWSRTITTGGARPRRLTVEMAADDSEKEETIRDYRLAVGAALLLTLLLAGGGGYMLAAQALRPVDDISMAAAGIDARSLNMRLPARPVDDELGRLVQTLNGMLERIENGVSAARRFTADASHELKTPIAAIRGTVDVTLLKERKTEEYEKALQTIGRESERLERIVRDLLTIARADAGSLVERRDPFDLRSVAGEVAEVGEILAQERGSRLESDAGEKPLTVEGDFARLRQVALNLVDNALRYGKQGGTVWLRTSRESPNALLVVEDDGPGIPEAERERVFERFHRGRRDVPGVGLGLAIARAIVTEHRGTIVATERPGGGARFEVRVPLVGLLDSRKGKITPVVKA